MSDWQPYREPLRVTLVRTFSIAIVGGAIVSLWSGGLRRWPILALLMLWPALGGHFVDLFFLNGLRPRLPSGRARQRVVRVALWFAGGILLAAGARLTGRLLVGRPVLIGVTWAIAGAAFVGIELVAHAGLHLRGRPSFYDGLG